MRILLTAALIIIGSMFAQAQNEQAPILEKEFEYKNWEFKRIDGEGKVDLRKFTAGKKLVLVVYFAPWCGNWRFEAPIIQRFYERYKDKGFDVIGVGEYDTTDAMRSDIAFKKLTFPIVYESESRDDRLTTTHFAYRSKVGDSRKWGSPFNIFLTPENIIKDGDVIARRMSVAAGELIEADAEKFIREKLGLTSEEAKPATTGKKTSEVCDPNGTVLKKP